MFQSDWFWRIVALILFSVVMLGIGRFGGFIGKQYGFTGLAVMFGVIMLIAFAVEARSRHRT